MRRDTIFRMASMTKPITATAVMMLPASVKAMTTNHLTGPQRAIGDMILGRGRGWGYGMAVVTDTVPGQPAPGSFGWIGGFGTSWISDPPRI
jgi:CubicO group peptidase (beta-lactamase class C family)